jgi:hypothetical protein
MLRMVSYSHRPKSGQITCYLNRTYHVLTTECDDAPSAGGGLVLWYGKHPEQLQPEEVVQWTNRISTADHRLVWRHAKSFRNHSKLTC